MKNIILIVAAGLALTLTGCGKSDLEKQIENDTAISKKMGEVKNIPRIVIPPDAPKKDKGGEQK